MWGKNCVKGEDSALLKWGQTFPRASTGAREQEQPEKGFTVCKLGKPCIDE
jgi:hypothetical protein